MRLAFAVMVLGACSLCQRVSAQAVVFVPATEAIPKNYRTWSLFLICNPKWLTSTTNDHARMTPPLFALYNQFKSFGRTIGGDHAAVWFWKKMSRSPLNDDLVSNVDVERSVKFCAAWNLKPSAGPHVVVTSTYPDESVLPKGLPANSAVFELGNMTADKISDLLAKVVDELVQNKPVATPAPAASPQNSTELVSLLQAVQRLVNNVGCAWTFKISAGPVSTEVHSCQQK